ncbi:MAG: cobalt-precorrin-5B (C(1))-methyltransferase CbiD, partial [Desulfarculaceae bacterium]|jgi:cobalt-precorrin-5B (C1)-methyltransferase
VPEGERLAKHTLNPRLGIVGGISIIGTTGLVKPFSHEAYTATIESGMSVARASHLDEVVLTTGGKSEKMAMGIRPDLPEQAFIQIADFYGFALRQAAAQDFSRVGLVVFFGKAVKQAAGMEYTHARQAPLDLAVLADWLKQNGAGPDLCQKTAEANTARQVLELLRIAARLDLVGAVGRRLMASARDYLGSGPRFWVVIVDYDGSVLFESTSQGVDK